MERERREATIKFTLSLERRRVLSNMLSVARALEPIAETGHRWDADAWLLGTPGGVIELKTGRCRPGRRSDRITMQTSVEYDADAKSPRWERFVREVFAEDHQLVDFVHRAVGYSLTGVTSEQVLFLMYGTGANGKGTLANTLKRILGDYAWNMPFATIEMKDRASIPNDLAALVGRRFITAAETNDGSRLNEARVKALTGCDPVTARFLHGEFFTFEPAGKYWLSVNHKPIVRDDSFGFWRRLRLIPFTQRFEVNPQLADELHAEAAGILAWCVRGALAWQERGLGAPDAVKAATRVYELESDHFAAFLADACEVAPDLECGARSLYEHYTRWADSEGVVDRMTSTGFGLKAKTRFEHAKGRLGMIYRGLAPRRCDGFLGRM